MREKLSRYKRCDGCGEMACCLPAGPDRWECEPCEGITNARPRRRIDPDMDAEEYPDMSEYHSGPEPNPYDGTYSEE